MFDFFCSGNTCLTFCNTVSPLMSHYLMISFVHLILCVVFAELHLILLNNQSCLTANMHADCTSFSLQKRLNIIKLFCLIQIIRQAGFRCSLRFLVNSNIVYLNGFLLFRFSFGSRKRTSYLTHYFAFYLIFYCVAEKNHNTSSLTSFQRHQLLRNETNSSFLKTNKKTK